MHAILMLKSHHHSSLAISILLPSGVSLVAFILRECLDMGIFLALSIMSGYEFAFVVCALDLIFCEFLPTQLSSVFVEDLHFVTPVCPNPANFWLGLISILLRRLV